MIYDGDDDEPALAAPVSGKTEMVLPTSFSSLDVALRLDRCSFGSIMT
jgi:hypothetical protein